MYWRVRNFGPEHLVRQYGVVFVCIISVFLNVILFTIHPGQSAKLSAQMKMDFEELARKVTTQLLDSSYLTYATNTQLLMAGGELTTGQGGLVQKLKQTGQLPKSPEELKANIRSLTDEKTVVAVRIDSVTTGEPIGQQGLIPVDLSGVVARHSASGADENRFHLRITMGLVATGQQQTSELNSHSKYANGGGKPQMATAPIVVGIQEVSGTPQSGSIPASQ